MLTIEHHNQNADGSSTLCVRVTGVAPDALAGIAGAASWAPPADGGEPTDTLVTFDWPADAKVDADPAVQRREARLLIEQALAPVPDAPGEPVALSEPGTEL